ncbi:MAG TPA: hypothetical protein PK826_05235, partial [Anaerolineae bacterium]|nr:hypothetical protein [Anaerolineae bacterium]
ISGGAISGGRSIGRRRLSGLATRGRSRGRRRGAAGGGAQRRKDGRGGQVREMPSPSLTARRPSVDNHRL